MSNLMRWVPAGLFILALISPLSAADDPIKDTRDRIKIEAERVEREFTDKRAAAYKLVRKDTPQLTEATELLRELMGMLREDTSLEERRRAILIVTIKADFDRVKDLAAERGRSTAATSTTTSREISRTIRDDFVRRDDIRRNDTGRRSTDEIRSIYDTRRNIVNESRDQRVARADRITKVMGSVDKSATPVAENVEFPRNWRELTKKRSTGQPMTAKEKAIIKVLDATLSVDYNKNTFEEVIEHLRKSTKVEIIVDKRALEEVGASYESTITLNRKSSVRTILKRILGDLNLAYVVKDEAILITSRERASQMTTTRTYYLGDLATVTDGTIPPLVSQVMALQQINTIINTITQNVDPQSWKVNNPDAVGTITFNPLNMSLVIKQTAEIHYKLAK